ncbi:MarR family winged helix-turn-helix transcriptional regulator [Gordonia sp. ABSL49_1]|uniref:MarR family winged helix-turn-helix transcriptional regulator n=1 Tax=unclassified Gordonia (in: high G+C Gram-positive bacteria) TaxID=2657482 RepID=UPI001F1140F3|nr:MarR family winged helix-turn-helix transcriptional regulator [Gordonia sp. ABSL49_1]MCH5644785.1 MarR family winged helix-turn-helix transcriptional regulator [Gordonia sp. ABSL49_1]
MAAEKDASFWPVPVYGHLADELLRLTRRKVNIHPDSILDNSAFTILWLLSDGRPRTLRQLTVDLDLEQSTVNRQVNAAIKHGYLERFDVEGSPSRRIRPTTRGHEAFIHDGTLRAGRLEQVFADLAPGTPESLLRELRAYNDAYDRVLHRQDRDTRLAK